MKRATTPRIEATGEAIKVVGIALETKIAPDVGGMELDENERKFFLEEEDSLRQFMDNIKMKNPGKGNG